MALDTGNYISDFDRANPTSSDPVSEGDDVLRFIKTVLQKTFPMGTDATGTATGVGPNQAVQVIIAKATAPAIGGTAAGTAPPIIAPSIVPALISTELLVSGSIARVIQASLA